VYPERIKAEVNETTNQDSLSIDEIQDIIELTDSARKNKTTVIRKNISISKDGSRISSSDSSR
jgi:hypothetical protein